MNIYIFLTFPIQHVGGGQCYVAAKARYLESQGWKVVVISGGNPRNTSSCPISYLDKYLRYKMVELNFHLYKLFPLFVDKGVEKMISMIGEVAAPDKVIIESHTDKAALWGELLAKKISARHFYMAMYEHYRRSDLNFVEKMNFYEFKMDRKEILCNNLTASRLFEGVRKIKEGEITPLIIDEAPIQDVKNEKVDSLKRYDYNICYLGRTHKLYVPHIINGVGEFASKHKDKTIQFIIVGDADKQRELIEINKERCKNLIISEVGLLHPIPKSLYSKIDVIIAGSGSARCSVEEGALTIIADTESDKAMGLLGYDTNESIYVAEDSVVTSYAEALERALINQVHKTMKYKYPPKMDTCACTKQNFELMSKASKEIKYFDEAELRKGRLSIRENVNLFRSILKL